MRKLTHRTLTLLLALCLLSAPAKAIRAEDERHLAIGQVAGAGVHFSMYVDQNGDLWTWGDNMYGQLGQRFTHPGEEDYRVSDMFHHLPAKALDNVSSVSCGLNFGAAVRKDHSLWVWGNNDVGQLGTNGRNNKGYVNKYPTGSGKLNDFRETSMQYQDIPTQMMTDVAVVVCANRSAAAIKTDGTLWTWGDNRYGQLGIGSEEKKKNYPVQIMEDVAAVSLSRLMGAAVKTDGTLWTWGIGPRGQLLGGKITDGKLSSSSLSPIQVGEGYRDVICGDTCFGLKEDNSLWAWGEVDTGCMAGDLTLGDKVYGRSRFQSVPLRIMEDVAAVECANQAVAARKTDGSLWVWGYDGSGILGVPKGGSDSFAYLHKPVKLLDNIQEVALQSYALALDGDGRMWAWGEHNALSKCYDPAAGIIDTFRNPKAENWQAPVAVPMEALFPIDEVPEPERLDMISAGIDPAEQGTAYPTGQVLELNGRQVELPGYALLDGEGGVTTYVRVRDLAWLLNTTAAQFDVDYDGQISLSPKKAYSGGTVAPAPFRGQQRYTRWSGDTRVGEKLASLQAFTLTDDGGGGHTYYKLRDLGQVLGFNVGWSRQRGMYLEPDKLYDPAD